MAAVLQYVSKGDSGPAVYVWQRILQWIDPALLPKYGPDGDFGDETVQAIKTVLPKSDGTQINARVGSLLLALFVEARAEAAASRELDADALERRITDAVLERVGTQTGGVTADQVEAIIEDKFDNFNANIKRI